MDSKETIIGRVQGKLRPDLSIDEIIRILSSIPYFDWVGIYLLEGDELVLGPYMGPATPHVRIPLERGVCGRVARTGRASIVDDVLSDDDYLQCNESVKSEIAIPIKRDDRILGVLDVDSNRPAAFDELDKDLLEKVALIISRLL
ncbi:MAG TPA: GAF domain-containing protein [Methanobacteriales archaeon]|nr:MAG: Putative GAF sensor protein [Methanobacteriaceae archaeon 41_258]MBC7090131.1 GAF domain-containing protein [Methanobacteriaceae archaeon]MBC7097032.1 GAF domain-containing protein [Methanobacteriales archaeon]HIH62543.1 GAF domain-containing protein [Methanobacteriales archaeon]